eukprot:PhM_4_TR1405/c0_g1_i1/m.70348
MAAKTKTSPKKSSPKKVQEYTGTRVIFNAGEEPKDPKRVAAAKKAQKTLRDKLKRRMSPKKGAGKKKSGGTRAPSSYFLFAGEFRAAVKKAHPTWGVTEIASELGKRWRALSDDKKEAYKKKAAAAAKK